MTEERYSRNIPAITDEEQALLKTKTAAVIGCGGLGGHIISSLARIGLKGLILIDSDTFSATNLNRQLLSNEANLGCSKVKEAEKWAKSVDSSLQINTFEALLTEDNAPEMLKGADIVIDALDNVGARLAAEKACEKLGIYFIHGAIAQWRLQVSSVAPGAKTLEKIYPAEISGKAPSVLAFTPSVCAGIQVAEALKVLTGRKAELDNRLLMGDLESDTFITIDL